ncbi:hypothetical protein PGT21_019033 [Puccinia graminis f. sp. tritici]|uniref:Uncharacterized protein n=1 Tax=Puccinia graminis f. sp. tritici TaxID=56615 RepID=A0A5B0NVG1_PUCGR|nr:hypothetical protein PGT21_019033 [Puccinia graminis f. sp. tritici]
MNPPHERVPNKAKKTVQIKDGIGIGSIPIELESMCAFSPLSASSVTPLSMSNGTGPEISRISGFVWGVFKLIDECLLEFLIPELSSLSAFRGILAGY